jgi:hypothetical protein
MRSARGLLLLVVCLVAGAAVIGWFRKSDTPPAADATPSAAPPGSRAASTSEGAERGSAAPVAAAPAVREPEAPVPARFAVEGIAEEQAAVLATQVLRGGDGAVAALATALDLAGFSIRNSDGTVIAPSGPSQGIAFNTWEVNVLANLVAGRRTLAAPLASVAAALASPLPGLTGEAMTGFILEAVRRPAHGTEGPLVFWSAFITELGRRARTHEQYDLRGDVDPATMELDIVQIAFITKRMAADVAALAHPERTQQPQAKAGFAWRLPAWLVQPVGAQPSPCQFTETETEILDWTAIVSTNAFGLLTGWLGGQGVVGAERTGAAAAYAGVVLSYLKLALTQWAFEISFEMENAPLVRTTNVRPQQGEQRTLVTKVSLDFGKVAWLNCFRIMLNAMGLDLNVDNDGPVKGAEVTWAGWAGFRGRWAVGSGPEQLVQFIGDENNRIQGSGLTSRSHANMNQVTNDQGEARVEITGIGQEEFLGSQPREVMKEASTSAMVVLKPANLVRDLKDAGQTAAGGLPGALAIPVELLLRTRWTFGGNYTFPVKDWRAGNGWTGTVSYRLIKRSLTENARQSICCGGQTTTHENREEREEIREGQWELPSHSGTNPLSADFSIGTGRMAMSATIKVRRRSHHTGWASCRGGHRPQTSTTNVHEQDGTADYTGTAEVTVQLDDSGEFLVSAGAPADGQAMGQIRSTTRFGRNDGCNGVRPERVDTSESSWRAGDISAHIKGAADPDAAELKGSLTKVIKSKDGRSVTTHIYEWSLQR